MVIGMDVNGVEVKENDWLVMDKEDIAYFFKVENGKPLVKANWYAGSLGLIDYDGYAKNVMKGEEVPDRVKEYVKEQQIQFNNIEVERVSLVTPRMKEILDQLDPNQKAYWALEGTLKRPMPYDKPYGTLKAGGFAGEF